MHGCIIGFVADFNNSGDALTQRGIVGAFDRSMIAKATKTYLGMTSDNLRLDLARITPALLPEMAKAQR